MSFRLVFLCNKGFCNYGFWFCLTWRKRRQKNRLHRFRFRFYYVGCFANVVVVVTVASIEMQRFLLSFFFFCIVAFQFRYMFDYSGTKRIECDRLGWNNRITKMFILIFSLLFFSWGMEFLMWKLICPTRSDRLYLVSSKLGLWASSDFNNSNKHTCNWREWIQWDFFFFWIRTKVHKYRWCSIQTGC